MERVENPIGVHALVWVGDWSPDSARRAVTATARCGFDLLEIPVLDPDAVDVDHTRSLLAEHGLGAACSLGLTMDADVSADDPAVIRRGLERLRGALRVTAGIGARHLTGVVYSALGKYAEPVSERGRAHCVESMATLAREAAAEGVTVGLEVVNRYESNVLNTAEQALALVADIGEPNVVVHLDTYHMNIEEADFAAPVARCADRLGYVHVGESHRGALGTGTVDFAAFFGALGAAGYRGPVTFESFSSAVVHPQLSSTLAIWRDLWQDGEELARGARAFVAAGLGAGFGAGLGAG